MLHSSMLTLTVWASAVSAVLIAPAPCANHIQRVEHAGEEAQDREQAVDDLEDMSGQEVSAAPLMCTATQRHSCIGNTNLPGQKAATVLRQEKAHATSRAGRTRSQEQPVLQKTPHGGKQMANRMLQQSWHDMSVRRRGTLPHESHHRTGGPNL